MNQNWRRKVGSHSQDLYLKTIKPAGLLFRFLFKVLKLIKKVIFHPSKFLWWNRYPDLQTPPLGMILRDKRASEQLHYFLLDNLDKDKPGKIQLGQKIFKVGIINLNPAPVLNGKPGRSGTSTP